MSRLASLKAYRPLLAARPVWSAAVAISNGVATLLEGVALVLLVPLIEMTAGGTSPQPEGLVTWLLDWMQPLMGAPTVPFIVAVFTGLAGLSALLNYWATYLTYGFGSIIEADLRQRLFHALIGMEWPYLARHKTGALVKALIQDSAQAGIGVVHLMFAVGAATSGLVLLTVAALLSWKLTLTAVAFTLCGIPFYMLTLRMGERSGRAASGIAEDLSGQTTELLGNAKLVFSLGLREFGTKRFLRLSHAYRKEGLRQAQQSGMVRFVFEFTGVLFVAAFLLVVLWWQQSPSSLAIVFLMIFYRLAPRISHLQSTLFRAATLGTWVESWQQLVRRSESGGYISVGTEPPSFQSELALRDVSFAFPEASPVFQHVHLSIPRGSTVALVGPSGHGKSTLLDLLTGLNRPTGGEILVDGRPLHEMDVTAWQRRIGIVLQENPILHASVAENIAFAEDDVDQARLEEAARRAGAFDFIMAMPQGFATVLGERGARLSGGQRQRIALARALYRRPWLLLLDEVTSALDGESAAGLVASLSALRGEVTMVFVTHREDVLHLADTVYEIRDGMVRPCAAAQPR